MVKEFATYTIICDNCGKDVCDGDDYSGYGDLGSIEDIAMDCGWTEQDGKHYCDDCWSYDDNDNIVLKPITQTP